jgi:hypothetical protein
MTSSSSTVLYPHQRLALERWLDQPRLGLALQPGLGKTRTVLECIKLAWELPRWLVVAPKRVALTVWRQENLKWGVLPPESVRLLTAEDFSLHAPTQKPPEAPQGWQPRELLFRDLKATRTHLRALITSHRVLVVTWDWVFWLAAALGDRPHFDGLVMDESHYVKTKGSKRFQAARRLAPGCVFRAALNGTPLTQGWEDTWSQSYLLDEGVTFGRTLGDFRQRFLRPVTGPGGRVIDWRDPSPSQRAELETLFPQLWMAMRAEDWVSLPDLIVNDVWVELEQPDWAVASALMRAALAMLPSGAAMLPVSVAAGLNKALQVCQGAAYTDLSGSTEKFHDKKSDALKDLVAEIDGGVIIFYQFRHDKEAIVRALGAGVAFMEDAGAQAQWEAGGVKCLASHPASMAVGLNLQGAGNNVVWYGLTWDLWLYEQGIKRMHRLGQAAPSVIVHRLMTRHPVERLQLDALERKGALLNLVMNLKGAE